MTNDYSININTQNYNIDIGQDQDFTITIDAQPDVVINLDKQGPMGPQGEPGSQGETGTGIETIKKTGTSGLVDTYTIYYTDGDTSEFTVTNGKDGHTLTYVYEQGVASDAWEINHNLNKFPSVVIVDSAGASFEGQVNYIDENNCIVYMNGATTGKAYLN